MKAKGVFECTKPVVLDLVSNGAKVHYLSSVLGMHVGIVGQVIPAAAVAAWRVRTRLRVDHDERGVRV
jgi:NADP-dependent 3-hydroxy acid dehydrogenase YdfG